jgi:hypothetical protein
VTDFTLQDKAFIAALKVGDSVSQVAYMRYSGISIATSSVKRVSPTGQITLENGDRFQSCGRHIGSPRNGSIVSPEHAAQVRLDIAAIKRAKAIRSDMEVLLLPHNKRITIDQFDVAKSLIDQLKTVLEI